MKLIHKIFLALVISGLCITTNQITADVYNPISASDDEFISELTENTWAYLQSDWATVNHLPRSWRSTSSSGGDYANPAEIGLLALSWLAAYDLQENWSPTWIETETEIIAILDQLRSWQTGSQSYQPNGPNAYNNTAFYQWYWISWDPPVVGADSGLNHLVPSIDNAWLAASLITIREYANTHNHTTLAQKSDAILTDMDFSLWYDDALNLFYWGAVEDPQGGAYADIYSNENRIINFIARALGDISNEEFLESIEALEANSASYNGITVEKVAWDGSYFTYTTPALFIQEINTVYGTNTILPATQAQILYAQEQDYEAWGLSDCYDIGNGDNVDYIQQGAPPTGSNGNSETESGVISAHASALGLITPLSNEAITNLKIISGYPCAYHTDYGFYDSVNTNPDSPEYSQCSDRFSALAQEWIFLSLVNYQNGFIWEYFYQDVRVQQTHQEMFYAGSPICYPLTLYHTGNGTNPVTSPTNSIGCNSGYFIEGGIVLLSNAIPDINWEISSWEETADNTKTTNTNYLIMPGNAHSAGVNYSDSTSPVITFTSPAYTGDSIMQPRAIISVDAHDVESGIKEVQFSEYHDGTWHILGTDTDSTDGWSWQWETYHITDQTIKIKAIAVDNYNNSTPVQLDNILLTTTHVFGNGYETRSNTNVYPIETGNSENNITLLELRKVFHTFPK